MSTFISFSNPQPGRNNMATTLAVGEEGGQVGSRYGQPRPGGPSTMAFGEEGGGQQNVNMALINYLLGRSSADDIAVDKFNQFQKDADSQNGKVTGDGQLTKTELEKQLKSLKSQQKTYQLLSSFAPQNQQVFSLLMQPLNTNIQVGQIMLDNFNTFAAATNQYISFDDTSSSSANNSSAISLDDIKAIAKRDGKEKYISKKDVNPWSTSSSSNYTSF